MILESPEEENKKGEPLQRWEGANVEGKGVPGAMSAAESTAELQDSKSIWDPFVT